LAKLMSEQEFPESIDGIPVVRDGSRDAGGGYEITSHSGEFEAPVDCAEEREKDSSIADLDGL
jgi:hypothetical protein